MTSHRRAERHGLGALADVLKPFESGVTHSRASGAVIHRSYPGTVEREPIIEQLIERKRLWPLMDHNSCHFCASPRKPEHAKDFNICWSCNQLRKGYGGNTPALSDLIPITYTTKDWALGAGLRKLKDQYNVDPRNVLALRMGAVLSLFLEHQLPRLSFPIPLTHIIPVPSSKPVVVNALQRAAKEGWWVPELSTDIVTADPNFPRQREREGRDRAVIKGKWSVDGDALGYGHVLLLDDITTSGGSLHSLAAALVSQGAGTVRAVVLGRNVGSDGEWILPLLEERHNRGARWSPKTSKRDIIHG
jgi:predicted amidophosphoribosyltransferase